VHGTDIVFIPARRDIRSAKSAAAIYGNQIGINPNLWLDRGVDVPDTSRVTLASNTIHIHADANIKVARGDKAPGMITNCRVADAGVNT